MRGLRIVDDTGSLFAPPPIAFRAREIGRDVFGWNVENAALADALEASAAALPNLVRMTADVAGFDFAPERAASRSPTDASSSPRSSSARTGALRRRGAPPELRCASAATRRAR